VLAALRALPPGEQRAAALVYLEPRLPLLQYPAFRAAGYPIGSGIVERANKVVVEDRLKGSGMHRAPRSVDPMLALRTIVCADRWEAPGPRSAPAPTRRPDAPTGAADATPGRPRPLHPGRR
jgi:hypothetical protein